jgi:hypothetical protein
MPENNAAAGPAEDLDANAIQKNMFVETTNLRYEATPIDPEIEKKVLRKINLFLMPAMVIGKTHLETTPFVRELISYRLWFSLL